MLEKINQLLNVCMGSFIGVFIGQCIYDYYFYIHGGWYEFYSAPWYTRIMLSGICVGIVLVVCIMGKIFIKRKMAKR